MNQVLSAAAGALGIIIVKKASSTEHTYWETGICVHGTHLSGKTARSEGTIVDRKIKTQRDIIRGDSYSTERRFSALDTTGTYEASNGGDS
jgi:hypothetical protein